MGRRIKKLKTKQADGSFDETPIGADAKNIDFEDGQNLEEKVQSLQNNLEWSEA